MTDFIKKKYQKLRNIKLNSRAVIFLFFLFVSTVFWFLNSLSKNYVTELTYVLRFKNYPKKKILVGKLPTNLKLKIEAYGFTILKHKINPTQIPIIIDINKKLIEESEKSTKHYIRTFDLKNEIQAQLSTKIKILEILPDSLIFQFSEIVRKKVAVKLNIKLNYTKQYIQKSKIITKPDSIFIEGAQNIIDTINNVYTVYKELNDINKTINDFIEIEQFKNLRYTKNKVKIIIPVEEYTELNLKIPIFVENIPDSLILKTFPSEIMIKCIVGLDNYKDLNLDMFRAVVDYKSIKQSLNKKIRVRLTKTPKEIYRYRFNPQNVEYVIEK